MPGEERKARICRIVEGAFGRCDLDAFEELYVADVVYHRPPFPDVRGLEDLRAYVAGIRRTFSDTQFVVEKVVLEEDAHAGRWVLQGRHTGRSPSMPVPPAGKRVTITGCSIARWGDGRIEEEWAYVDWLGLFRQLGVVPPMR